MLFGLTDRTDLNGMHARIVSSVADLSDDDGRVAVEVVQAGQCVQVLVRWSNLGHRASADLSSKVLSDQDMSALILGQYDHLSDVGHAAKINSAFRTSSVSEPLWKMLCVQRWRSKWGFTRRLAHAETSAREGMSWRHLYQREEKDAMRVTIRVEELLALRWDFRFWFGPPNFHIAIPDQPGGTMRGSGLRVKVADDMRMVEDSHDPSMTTAEVVFYREWRPEATIARGRVLGHPQGDLPKMRWYLVDGGTAMVWGYAPHLWPKGRLFRTPNWGWELHNPNVCLRAHDTSAVAAAPLWGDVLQSLRPVQLGNTDPDGEPALMEMSPSWIREWGRQWEWLEGIADQDDE